LSVSALTASLNSLLTSLPQPLIIV